MSFAHPWLLLLLVGIPLLAWLRGRAGKPAAFVYSSVGLVKSITGINRSSVGKRLLMLRWISLTLLIIALARPQLGEGDAKIRASGIDIVISLDLSGSMAAEDFEIKGQPVNRLVIAKDVIEQFVEKRENDRIGLVAFAGRAYIASPLTLDHPFLLENLDRLTLGSIEDGTAIGAGISAAVNRLRDLKSKSKVVILMTDGQNNAGKVPPATAAEAAQALGVRVYTIGVGTKGIARMPYVNVFGQKGYIDQQVDIDEETLTEVAKKTGGKYYRAENTEGLRRIYAEIDQLEKSEVEVKKYQRYMELFHWFILAGLFFLLLEVILGHTVWRRLP
ncbi:MAG: vWA domain-containing protein [Verrucomicrobiales bacterium]